MPQGFSIFKPHGEESNITQSYSLQQQKAILEKPKHSVERRQVMNLCLNDSQMLSNCK